MTSLFAYLSYRDAPAAIDWLEAIDFRVVPRQPANDGSILHAELRLGDAVVMLSTADADYTMPPLVGRSTGSGLYLLVDDVDAIHAAASAAGATAVLVPETTDWGTQRARVLEPEGHEWSFGTYNPAAVGEVPGAGPAVDHQRSNGGAPPRAAARARAAQREGL
jgi:uncharacterized glyoxalase superfamily protein PhnB